MVSQNPTGPIEAVVFDMGGVLTVDPIEACRDYAGELVSRQDTFVDQFRGPEFAEVETGDRSVRDYLKFACRDVEERLGVRSTYVASPIAWRPVSRCAPK